MCVCVGHDFNHLNLMKFTTIAHVYTANSCNGYMSSEYARYGNFSKKLDVFSFEVLLVEIVSGKRNAAFHHFEHSLALGPSPYSISSNCADTISIQEGRYRFNFYWWERRLLQNTPW
ncbi:putative non-specific protein-tyrosine kinase RLK-Pelle-DLSV family [Rosa chinensis]|uniref:Putative non-specific protein-tyrosine kinase RLK-Pelle-DLSV family n=1 Tax=Rosa chinensis TaxID=74649 RepID=A0A2P6SAT9_ROSCH|nr:putative non-specific protein-tyrosine kinase RLK-Pelle-DLSV family [Rosa chinensis]